jgi:hypothetical protein
MTTSIPICFYPMRKIVLDDDQAFCAFAVSVRDFTHA